MTDSNREAWLEKAIQKFGKDLFKPVGYTIPKVRVSVGLPYGRGSKKAIGQHWVPEASDDKVGSIFISPTINYGVEVLGTLVHELVHASVGNQFKHGPKFRKCAVAVGLEGPMKATVAGDALTVEIKKIIKAIGKYPHAKLNLAMRPTKKQTTRMLKVHCPTCDFTCRAALTKIIASGVPLCGCNHKPMDFELPDDGEIDL